MLKKYKRLKRLKKIKKALNNNTGFGSYKKQKGESYEI